MKEYDTIVLKTPLAGTSIPIGTRGVILMVFESPSKAYEVEFIDTAKKSLGTFTVREEQLEPVT